MDIIAVINDILYRYQTSINFILMKAHTIQFIQNVG